jgi:hypothetical protein
MNSFRLLFIISCAAFLASCSNQILYVPDPEPGTGHYGYSDLPIDADRFEVTFTGNFDTPTQTVDQYALYRCAELTNQHGYDYFIVEHTRHWNIFYHHRSEEVTTYKMRMYHGVRPERNSNSYDANSMLTAMGPTIKRGN